MLKVLLVFGTRPEAIKMAPVYRALQRRRHFDTKICVTAQHRHLLDQVLNTFDIKPDFDLDLMEDKQDLTDITTRVLNGLRDVLKLWRPDLLLVHGDTTTTFAATLSAFYQGVPVGHVEAGLRTGDINAPWPEEANRRLTSVLAQLHFSPTSLSAQNLIREGVTPSRIFVTGNTVIDALKQTVDFIENSPQHKRVFKERFAFIDHSRRLLLVTSHRRENFGEGLESICRALARIAERPDAQIIYPVHLNPSVRRPVERILKNNERIHLLDPVEYKHFVCLLNASYLVLTDSGGIQEEAPALQKPVLLMRDKTERPEAVEAGTVQLVGTDEDRIVLATNGILDSRDEYERMRNAINPYGNGTSAEQICDNILNVFLPH